MHERITLVTVLPAGHKVYKIAKECDPKCRICYSCTMASQWVWHLYHLRVNDVLPRAKPEEVHH